MNPCISCVVQIRYKIHTYQLWNSMHNPECLSFLIGRLVSAKGCTLGTKLWIHSIWKRTPSKVHRHASASTWHPKCLFLIPRNVFRDNRPWEQQWDLIYFLHPCDVARTRFVYAIGRTGNAISTVWDIRLIEMNQTRPLFQRQGVSSSSDSLDQLEHIKNVPQNEKVSFKAMLLPACCGRVFLLIGTPSPPLQFPGTPASLPIKRAVVKNSIKISAVFGRCKVTFMNLFSKNGRKSLNWYTSCYS